VPSRGREERQGECAEAGDSTDLELLLFLFVLSTTREMSRARGPSRARLDQRKRALSLPQLVRFTLVGAAAPRR